MWDLKNGHPGPEGKLRRDKWGMRGGGGGGLEREEEREWGKLSLQLAEELLPRTSGHA